MANTFLPASATDIGTTETIVYTVPANTKAVVIGFVIANKLGYCIQADIAVGPVSLPNIPIPAGGPLGPLAEIGKLVLSAGQTIKVTASVDNAADAHLSLMEIS